MKITLCWHMHQPYYRDELHMQYRLPWVYLHAIKDYSDMAWHLERHPDMRVVVNFSPVLLEQLTDYSKNMQAYLDSGTAMNDPQLNLLAGVEPIPADATARLKIIKDCQRCNVEQMINPWPIFRNLVQYAKSLVGKGQHDLTALTYLDASYFYDLLVWYHLSWMGHSLKQQPQVQRLLKKQSGYSEQDRRELIGLIQSCIENIIPRYRQLAERNQIELSMTPWGHPIVPLLNDFNNMQCSQPDAPRPDAVSYPDGTNRSHWHIQKGIEVFNHYFGRPPTGVWLSEGAVSLDALQCLDAFNIRWTASGESVWRHSEMLSGKTEHDIAHKHGLFKRQKIDNSDCSIFFRDDGLSDLIGFEYQNWDAESAVANFTMHIKNISEHLNNGAEDSLISVILDGENAWEYYPDNANEFLDRLYNEMTSNEAIETITFSQALDALPGAQMSSLCPGSWVYGTFSTWIGEDAKNRAWDLLVEAKQQFDDVIANGRLDAENIEKATRQLAICEGSDWFWWFGDYNPSKSVQDFDQLYRSQLRRLYELLGCMIPANLDIALSHGSSQTASAGSGTMRRNN